MAMIDIIRTIRTAIYGRDMREAIAQGFEELDARTIPVDDELSPTSENPVQNKVITNKIAGTDRRLDALYDLTQGQAWDFDIDTNNAYSVPVPSGAKLATVQKYGGKSLVFNQLVQNGNFASTDFWSTSWSTGRGMLSASNNVLTYEFSVINTEHDNQGALFQRIPSVTDSIPSGHKAFIASTVKYPKDGQFKMVVANRTYATVFNGTPIVMTANSWATYSAVVTLSDDATYILNCFMNKSGGTDWVVGDQVQFKNIVCIDLTKMFGAGNEPTTVEEVKALLPNDYYAYNTGEIIHADVDKIDVVGKNKFDGVGREGYYNATTGVFVSAVGGSTFANTNKVYVSPNTTYYFKCPSDKNIVVFEYDANGSFVRRNLPSVTGSSVVTTTSTTAYINFHIGSYGTTYNNDILVCKGSSGTFIPYSKQTYPIPQAIQSLEGYGWSAGSVYNEVDFERKKYIKRVGKYTFSGSESMSSLTILEGTVARAWAYCGASSPAQGGNRTNIICDKLATSQNFNTADSYTVFGGNQSFPHSIIIKLPVSVASTLEDFTAWLTANKPTVYYELETPIETDITDILEPFPVEAGGTVTFHNSNGDGYRIPVPSTEEYAVKLSEVVSNG